MLSVLLSILERRKPHAIYISLHNIENIVCNSQTLHVVVSRCLVGCRIDKIDNKWIDIGAYAKRGLYRHSGYTL